MKFVSTVSSIYFSSSIVSSFLYPPLFTPLTITYIAGVGEYEVLIVISFLFLFFYSNSAVEHILYVSAFVFIFVMLWYSIKFRKGNEAMA
jgi:hypothetical protein